jgi:hypothetical protein
VGFDKFVGLTGLSRTGFRAHRHSSTPVTPLDSRVHEKLGSPVAFRGFGDDYVVNMSVWEDVASLSNYAFKSDHVEIMRRRREWFHPMAIAYAVLWWVPVGHRPTVVEAGARLDYLREHGATEYAFTFKQPYQAPDSRSAPQSHEARSAFEPTACE